MFDDMRDPQPTQPAGSDMPFDFADAGFGDSDFGDPVGLGFDDLTMASAAQPSERLILGMTAQQRAVLSVFLFLDVSVLGCVCLLALGRIAIPIP